MKKTQLKAMLNTFITLSIVALFYTNCAQQSDDMQNTLQSATCSAPPGVSDRPQTIAQAVQLINALPKPTTVACFVSSLRRPLDFYATSSMSSAQPAAGARSPRVFIFTDYLIISVVPDGVGRNAIEFGELKGANNSVKGELAFPVASSLSLAAPFNKIASGGGTVCSSCHRLETRDTSITYAQAYLSSVVKPFAFFRVAPNQLLQEQQSCDIGVERERCEILNALMLHGPMNERDFGSASF